MRKTKKPLAVTAALILLLAFVYYGAAFLLMPRPDGERASCAGDNLTAFYARLPTCD